MCLCFVYLYVVHLCMRAQVHSYADVLKHKQFRFQDIVVLSDPYASPLGMLTDANPSGTAANTNTNGQQTLPDGRAPPVLPSSSPSAPAAAAAQQALPSEQDDGALVPRAQRDVLPSLSLVPQQEGEEGAGRGGALPTKPGQVLYRISHEVRSLSHPLFLRPLFNRGANNGGTFV